MNTPTCWRRLWRRGRARGCSSRAVRWHTFWNAGDTPCLIIDVISPAGFENYFREIAEVWGRDEVWGREKERAARINEKYALDMDFESVTRLCERFGLRESSSE